MDSLSHFKVPWKASLTDRSEEQTGDFPDYHVADPESLVCMSRPESFEIGTGASIYTRSLLPAIREAKREVILVTCFWAPSSTLSALSETLEWLAEERAEQVRDSVATGSPDAEELPLLRIRLCFSSRSLFQKLFHTTSRAGYIYPPESWPTKLGLPSPEVLKAGRIDLRVKSLFFFPFSVMHPKFLIIDRRKAFLPSCNVSWEPWLEGCVEVTGDVVGRILQFYRNVWDDDMKDIVIDQDTYNTNAIGQVSSVPGRIGLTSYQSPATLFRQLSVGAIPTVLLPSSHHQNPQFRPFPWQLPAPPPATPLNHGILRLLDMSQNTIYMQTPNLTSSAVVDALVNALQRGVDTTIVTGKGMMLLEQIVTAGTTTSVCLRSLMRRYTKMQARISPTNAGDPVATAADLEAQDSRLGKLKISYFRPAPGDPAKRPLEEPVQSHLKLTIVDGQYTVLGSGNMDRASWFTSQELGIMFQSAEFATSVSSSVSEVLSNRLEPVFDSELA
ncbi:hypothetical protein SLS62_007461 [Diatrype stigma]|uniref:PLD phosphodiesterase domain-containing protein n=1 Tax=Diatrype stigma TaxID=117547 RepID=A0AAN9UWP9_9PEZI